jgi:nucleotide-binding universal stress UspA family protein
VKTILVGYDGTRSAERALNRAAELAHAFKSRVVVVSVSTHEQVAGTGGAFGLMPFVYIEADQIARTDEALWQQHRGRVQEFFSRAGVPVEFAGVTGSPAEAICESAEAHDVDLIVVGTREPGFLQRLLGGGSVSQDVARRAHRDVLIVHPAGDGG